MKQEYNAGWKEALCQLNEMVVQLEQENKELREALADTEKLLEVISN